MSEPRFIDRIDDPEAFVLRSDLVQTDSTKQAYGVLKALAWHPNVKISEELFFGDGASIVAIIGDDVAPRRNPEQMGFDPAYWANKLDAYPRWETAWWREVVQNARDAGATRIDLECRLESYTSQDGAKVEAVRCTCRDNGKGMDADTLRKAFLTFGGSQKESGSVGGFGDAKELIIIPWLGYQIRTRRLVAHGEHNVFDIAEGREDVSGVEVTAWMPKEKATTEVYAKAFIERCNLPGITFTVNGSRVRADLAGGEEADVQPITRHGGTRVGELKIFHNSRSRRRGVLIRSNGLFMFEKYVPEGQYKGIIYIELSGSARDLFDQKRVQFSYRTDVQELVDKFIADLTVDQTALTRRNKGKERKYHGGSGELKVQAGFAAEIAARMSMSAPVPEMKSWKGGAVSFDDKAVDAIEQVLAEREEKREVTEEPRPQGEYVPAVRSAVRVMLEETKFVGADHATNALRLMAWEPVFLLVNEVDFFTVPTKARPEGMSPTYKTLLTLWSEVCRFVLMRLGWTEPFGVGFIFSWDKDKGTTALAAYTMEESTHFLLINPFKLKVVNTERDHSTGDIVSMKYENEERWKIADDETLKMICAAAVHEATHMVNGISAHNESFAAALTENMGALIDMLPVAKKIRGAVTSRKARAERREAKPAAARIVWSDEKSSGFLFSTGKINGQHRYTIYGSIGPGPYGVGPYDVRHGNDRLGRVDTLDQARLKAESDAAKRYPYEVARGGGAIEWRKHPYDGSSVESWDGYVAESKEKLAGGAVYEIVEDYDRPGTYTSFHMGNRLGLDDTLVDSKKRAEQDWEWRKSRS